MHKEVLLKILRANCAVLLKAVSFSKKIEVFWMLQINIFSFNFLYLTHFHCEFIQLRIRIGLFFVLHYLLLAEVKIYSFQLDIDFL
jgi:hypothetical protein